MAEPIVNISLSRVRAALITSIFCAGLAITCTATASASAPLAPTQTLRIEAPSHLGGVPLMPAMPAPVQSPAYSVAATMPLGPVEDVAPPSAMPGVDPISTAGIHDSVFRSVAIPMRNFPVSARWRPIMSTIAGCAAGTCFPGDQGLGRLLAYGDGKGFTDKLVAVNRGVNALIAYRKDTANYGARDYWADPAETLAARAGDCEDFAILKMAALARLGIPLNSMSLVVLHDRSRNVFHAVLSVTTSKGIYILDNLSNRVLRDTALGDYVALFSLSNGRAWIHGSRGGGSQADLVASSLRSVSPGEGPAQ